MTSSEEGLFMNDLFPAWAGKLTAHFQASVILRRLEGSDLRQLLRAASPTAINDLLFVGEESAQVCPHRPRFPVSITYFSTKQLSGVNRIDERLTPHRSAYVVFCNGEIVHESWVRFDTTTPSQYGFDSHVPVIESFTARSYRGNSICPYVLSNIVRDLKTRQIANRIYALVQPTNSASIRGLEKAGFQLHAHLKGTRLLGLYIINKSIERVSGSLDRQQTKSSELPIAS
jgi:RimJ/RimL family protein N-acetyltransferase